MISIKFINIFSEKIKLSDIKFVNQTLKDLHPSDVADLIENLSVETRSKLIEIEEFNIEPDIFVELNESIQTEVLQLLSIDSISKIIKRLDLITLFQYLRIWKRIKKSQF